MLKIGFDAKRIFHNFTGLGNYSRSLVENLAKYFPQHAYHLYTPKLKEHIRSKAFLDRSRYHLHTASIVPASLWRSFLMHQDLKLHQLDIYHGLSHEIPFHIRKSGIKSVVSIHDMIFKKYPEQYPFFDRQLYNWKFRYACEQANKVIAMSENTRQDIIEYYNIPPSKIEVIYQSCHPQFFQKVTETVRMKVCQQYKLPQTYLLYVGSIIPRKRLLSIVKAMKITDTDIPLVVLGEGKRYKQEVKTYIRQHHLDHRVLFPKNVSFSDFPAIYQQASIFIYPSIYEGFGIPIIEALYSKIPVITAFNSSLAEASGPEAYFINPHQTEEIAAAIDHILTDHELSTKMIEKGYEHVQSFHPERLSRQLMQVYQRLLENSLA